MAKKKAKKAPAKKPVNRVVKAGIILIVDIEGFSQMDARR